MGWSSDKLRSFWFSEKFKKNFYSYKYLTQKESKYLENFMMYIKS